MKYKKVLVTGGAGFIGSHLVDRLVTEGHKVSIIDDLSGGFIRNVNPKSKFYEIDLRDTRLSNKIITKIKPELVYHLAANAAEIKSNFSPIEITSRNWNTFINTLVPALKNGMKRFIFTSSVAVYGTLQTPFKESDKPEPEDLYGISKLAIEQSLKILSKVHHFGYIITRPHNVYGPRQNMNDPYRNVVTLFMNSLLKKKPYYIYGNGQQRRCFSYIDDVTDALFKCSFKNLHGMIFNIGTDKSYSINELSNLIQEVTGIKIAPIYLQSRPQEVEIAIPDHKLAKEYLGYKERLSLYQGLQCTWNYAKQLGYQKAFLTKVELSSRLLPKNWKSTKN